MNNSEKDEIIKSCEAALYFSGDVDHVTVNFERKTLESLVSMLKRIDVLRCLKIINDEDIYHYSREEIEHFIKNKITHALVEKLKEEKCIMYLTDKDPEYAQTRITASMSIIKPEV